MYIRAKSFFLTYPRCPVSKQTLFSYFKDGQFALNTKLVADLQSIVVAHEEHKEEGEVPDHLHVFLSFDKKVTVRNERLFDFESYHPNIQAARSSKDVVKYCKKEGDYLEHGISMALETLARKSHKSKVAVKIINGTYTKEDLDEHPEDLFLLKAAYEGLHAFKLNQPTGLKRATNLIPAFFDEPLEVKHAKKRHFWIWSSIPNTGKTRSMQAILAKHPGFFYNYEDSGFQSGVFPDTQFVIIDEYNSPVLKIMDLNKMCDGTFAYKRKVLPAITLTDPIVIVCSNLSMQGLYSRSDKIPLLQARFNEIELKEEVNITDEDFKNMVDCTD